MADLRRAVRVAVAVGLIACSAAGCAGAGHAVSAASAPDPLIAARQQAREQQLHVRLARRDSALGVVSGQRRRAAAELLRLQHVRGHASGQTFTPRYGSDGTGDPAGWQQNGPHATKAPNSTPATIAQFQAAQAAGRISLVGAAQQQEVTRGLIDDRVLLALIALSGEHRLTVNSLRISHPRTVQDELGTPTDSNHIFGRAADISAVDGVPCKRETTGKPYRTLLDNPPPAQIGPCLALAYLAAQITGPAAPGEVIFYWRVPGPTGVSLPNHDDHLHIGFRNYPSVADSAPTQTSPQTADTDSAADLQLPSVGESHTVTAGK